MTNLCLHCGGRLVERGAVQSCPTPPRTESWVPIPHYNLLTQIESTLARMDMEIVTQAHALWSCGQRYFALLEVRNGHSHADYSLVVGIRNSHDKSFPASLAVGSCVFVCDNLAFSGEVTIARRHTTFIERDMPQLVTRAVGMLGQMRVVQDRRIESYKSTVLSDALAHDLIVRSLDSRIVPVTHIPDVVRQWRRPAHRQFAEGGMTAWRLFNAFTEAIKGRNLQSLPARTQALHGLMDAACGVAATAAA